MTAASYRLTYCKPNAGQPAKVATVTGLALSTIGVKQDEWREWTGGRMTYTEVPPVTRHYARYGNPGNGPFDMTPWTYRPMAERDAANKLAAGWAYAEVKSEPVPPHAFHPGVGPKCAICEQVADHPIHPGT